MATPSDTNAAQSGEKHRDFQVIDKRHFVQQEGELGPAPKEEKPRYPSFVEELMARVAETEKRYEQRRTEMNEELARTRARLEAEFGRQVELEKMKFVKTFLEVLDNLERALRFPVEGESARSLLDGLSMTAALFRSRLQSHGVEAVDVVNQQFDPNVGEAIGTVRVDDAAQDGLVLDEVVRGYRMGAQLIRPAQVRVGRYEGSEAANDA